MVANTIYTTTHDGLTRLVSARVASKVLDSALRSVDCSAETVSAKQMASVIKGPVVQELSNILPRAGLERSLKTLLTTLQALPSDEDTASGDAGRGAVLGDTLTETAFGHETDSREAGSREAGNREADVQVDAHAVASPIRVGRGLGVTPTGGGGAASR